MGKLLNLIKIEAIAWIRAQVWQLNHPLRESTTPQHSLLPSKVNSMHFCDETMNYSAHLPRPFHGTLPSTICPHHPSPFPFHPFLSLRLFNKAIIHRCHHLSLSLPFPFPLTFPFPAVSRASLPPPFPPHYAY